MASVTPEDGKYKQPECYGCHQKIKFKKGDKTRLNLDGSIHHCPPKEEDFEPQKDEIIKSKCKACGEPVFQEHGLVALYAEYDCKNYHQCKIEQIEPKVPRFQSADTVPVRPRITITKIIVSRTLGIKYGKVKEYGVEKEEIFNSMTIGMEADTEANFAQAELVTHDLVEQVNFIMKTEFSDKYKLRMLKNE